jgi:hypothetical protein
MIIHANVVYHLRQNSVINKSQKLTKMENHTNSFTDNETIGIDNYGLKQLAETRKWSMFLSILGFIFLGLIFIITIFMVAFGRQITGFQYRSLALIPLLLIGSIYFFPIYYLFQFSYYSKQALINKDNGLLSKALRYLKMHYRYMGILIIIMLSLYLIIIAIMIILGNSMNMFEH